MSKRLIPNHMVVETFLWNKYAKGSIKNKTAYLENKECLNNFKQGKKDLSS